MKWLADENFPYPSFHLLLQHGLDVIHVGTDFPSITDARVLEICREESRILLTFDRDYGDLIFRQKMVPPPGVVYFRIREYTPKTVGIELIDLIAHGLKAEGQFTVVKETGIKQRPL